MLLGRMDPKHNVEDSTKRQPHGDNRLAGLPVGIDSPHLPSPWKRPMLRLLLVAQC